MSHEISNFEENEANKDSSDAIKYIVFEEAVNELLMQDIASEPSLPLTQDTLDSIRLQSELGSSLVEPSFQMPVF
jgi:hypothetical protein